VVGVTVIRRHGNRWQVTVYAGIDPVTGSERRARASVPAKPGQARPPKEARELEARLLLEVGAGDHRDVRVTVAELLEQWLEQAGPDLAASTLHGYRRYIRRNIVPTLGNVRLDKLTTPMLDRLYRELRASGGINGRPLAPASVRQVHAVLHRALGQAERWGWINRNPAVLASPPKLVRKEIRPPTPHDVGRMLRAAHEEEPGFGLALWLAAVTGARRGELCGIRWDDVDLPHGSVVIRHSVIELDHRLVLKDPKTHQIRRVALDDATIALLRTRHATQTEHAFQLGARLPADAYVLSDHPVGAEPLHPNLLSDRFRRLVRRLQIACRLHDLRHWHVTQALGAGLPVRDVAERVGHASATMTLDVYGHAIESADRKTAETISAVLRGAMEDDPPRPRARPRRKSPGREPMPLEYED
jgi:integrase